MLSAGNLLIQRPPDEQWRLLRIEPNTGPPSGLGEAQGLANCGPFRTTQFVAMNTRVELASARFGNIKTSAHYFCNLQVLSSGLILSELQDFAFGVWELAVSIHRLVAHPLQQKSVPHA